VATHQTVATDASLDQRVDEYLSRLNAWDADLTQSVLVDTELTITRERSEAGIERFHVAPLRASTGQMEGLALLLTTDPETAHIRTEGLCTVVADVLVQLRK
jgi:hypothetical protein